MMEFTCDGMVRYGFGFYNPNHAAAMICAIMPFLWGWKRCAWLGWSLSAALSVPLVMTCSRTGLLVLGFELFAFFLLTGRKNWKWPAATIALLAVFAVLWGAAARFSPDGAVANRPLIWAAGLKLAAANPLGVGLGNSGEIVSAFLLPERIQCRTLVNSHLTLLAEFGMIAGWFWIAILLYALLRGVQRPAVWCALAGMTVSAGSASVFDWSVLFDFSAFGGLPILNFILSWGLLLGFTALAVIASSGKFRMRRAAVAAVAATLAIAAVFAARRPETPRTVLHTLVLPGTPCVEMIRDAAWTLRALAHCRGGGGAVIPLSPVTIPDRRTGGIPVPDRVVFFGEAGALFRAVPAEIPVYFAAPSEFVELPPNLRGVMLPVTERGGFLEARLRARGVPILPMPE